MRHIQETSSISETVLSLLGSHMRRAFSNAEAASWLLLDQQVPPSALDPHSNPCLVLHVLTSNNLQQIRASMEADSVGRASDQDKNLITPHASPSNAPLKPETLLFFPHAQYENRCFMTLCDNRMPMVFIESPSAPVAGVKRVTVEFTQEDYVIYTYYRLQNGNSVFSTFVYPSRMKNSPVKFFILLKPFPPSRYPEVTDILESAILEEQHECQYCILQVPDRCICRTKFSDVLRFSISGITQKDVMDAWSWVFCNRDTMLTKNVATFRSHKFGLALNAEVFAMLRGEDPEQAARRAEQGMRPFVEASTSMILQQSLNHELKFTSIVSSVHQAPQDLSRGFMPNPTNPPYTSIQGLAKPAASHPTASSRLLIHDSERPPSRHSGTDHHASPLASTELKEEELPANDNEDASMSDGDDHEQPSSESLSKEQRDAAELIREIDSMKVEPDMQMTCRICNAVFKRKFDYKRHVKARHLLERSYECDRCQAKFKRSEHLDSHVFQVHEKMSFPCSVCGKILTSDSNRRRHLRNVHHVSSRNAPSGQPATSGTVNTDHSDS